MFTLTDRPYETMWNHLRLLSYESNARGLLTGELSARRALCPFPMINLDEKARQLSYCIVQAFQYYKAGDAVTIDTSPLLYFYGMLSLSKALIIANEPGTLLDEIKYHGLKAVRGASTSNIETLSTTTDEGVFAHLTQVVQGFKYPKGAAFVLSDILSISPELSEIYELLLKAPSRCLSRYYVRHLSNDPYNIELCVVAPSVQYITERIPELIRDFDLRPNEQSGTAALFQWFKSRPPARRLPTDFWWYNPVAGGEYLVGALQYSLAGNCMRRYLYPPLSDYIGMFILSDCVRYKQDLWQDVVQGRETGVLGLIELFIDISRRRFPNLILNQLFKEAFEYAPKHKAGQTIPGTTYWPAP